MNGTKQRTTLDIIIGDLNKLVPAVKGFGVGAYQGILTPFAIASFVEGLTQRIDDKNRNNPYEDSKLGAKIAFGMIGIGALEAYTVSMFLEHYSSLSILPHTDKMPYIFGAMVVTNIIDYLNNASRRAKKQPDSVSTTTS